MLERIRRLRRSARQPHYEVVTSLTIDECRERLAGRPVDGKWMVSFARPLRFEGWITRSHINVDLPGGAAITGRFISENDGTRIPIWTSKPERLRDKLPFVLPAGIAIATVLGFLPGSVSSLLFVTGIFAVIWLRRRLRISRLPTMTPDETVRMIANHIQAHVIRELRNAPPAI